MYKVSAPRLLSADDPAPFRILNPDGTAPILIVCDHASKVIPRRLADMGLSVADRQRHIAWDIGAQAVSEQLVARFDAPAVLCGYSRLVIDVNRQLWDPSGLPEISDGTVIPANQDLSVEDRVDRIREIFLPYHWAIEERIAYFHARGVAPALLAIHSFTPSYQDQQRPWHIGILWDHDDRIAAPLIARLRARGDLQVGDNQPYSGKHLADYTIDHHGEAAGLPCVSVEIRQDLIDTEQGIEKWAQILGDTLADIFADRDLYKVMRR